MADTVAHLCAIILVVVVYVYVYQALATRFKLYMKRIYIKQFAVYVSDTPVTFLQDRAK